MSHTASKWKFNFFKCFFYFEKEKERALVGKELKERKERIPSKLQAAQPHRCLKGSLLLRGSCLYNHSATLISKYWFKAGPQNTNLFVDFIESQVSEN